MELKKIEDIQCDTCALYHASLSSLLKLLAKLGISDMIPEDLKCSIMLVMAKDPGEFIKEITGGAITDGKDKFQQGLSEIMGRIRKDSGGGKAPGCDSGGQG